MNEKCVEDRLREEGSHWAADAFANMRKQRDAAIAIWYAESRAIDNVLRACGLTPLMFRKTNGELDYSKVVLALDTRKGEQTNA